ncbi:arsenate reductase (glutaredoxin) [Pasteurellaceae bacterium 15-036681]|nr:arsenate reductase (glutaredoxin) [Pasteurellaceae bacterium 15-036681]
MVTIYHNPKCSKSRETLALIREAGIEPTIVEYLKNPLSAQQVAELIQQSGLNPLDAIRTDVEPYTQFIQGKALSDADIFTLIAEYPVLLNRPFVSGAKGTKLCRPSELVREII